VLNGRFLILAQTRARSAAQLLRTSSHRTTRQGLRSLSGHDLPRRTILMPWSKSETIITTALVYQMSPKPYAGRRQLDIIGRQQIRNSAHWLCGTWDGCTNMGTASHRLAPIRTYEFLELNTAQDFHLAKRYYDTALDTNDEAYLPVMLSLFRLHAHSLWHTLIGREGGLSLWSSKKIDSSKSYFFVAITRGYSWIFRLRPDR